MKIGVWTSNRVLAEDTIAKIEKTFGDGVVRRRSYSDMLTQDDQGNMVKWVRPSENARGYKFDKVYVDIQVSRDILFTIILPCLWRGNYEDVIWIADKQTTVYDYLHALPQPLFEEFVLGLMGTPLTEECQQWFHEWMQQPYDMVFPTCNLSDLKSGLTMPLDHMTMLLGKTVETLPQDKQEKLKNAMKDYCEVCDYINQELVNKA